MFKRQPKLLLEDILDSAEKILKYTRDISYEEFVADSMTVDAVIRNYEIIGEASNRLPQDFKDETDSIDWFQVRGFRNKIIHEYFGIDYDILWSLKETHLKTLIEEITKILEKRF